MERNSWLPGLVLALVITSTFSAKGAGATGRMASQTSTATGSPDKAALATLSALSSQLASRRRLTGVFSLGLNLTATRGAIDDVLTYPPEGIILQYNNRFGTLIASTASFTFGTFTAVIKAPGGLSSGVVSAFYLASTLPSDTTPYGDPTRDEVDFEFLGNNRNVVQTQYLVNGVGWSLHEKIVDLGFDSAADFHTYTLVWGPDRVEWYVDGLLVRQELSALTPIPSKPMYLYLAIWSSRDEALANPGLLNWVGAYDGSSAPYLFNVAQISAM